jgi:hypothetical protein
VAAGGFLVLKGAVGAFVLAMLFSQSLDAQTKWLAVVSTSRSVAQAVAGAKRLRTSSGRITTVASSDCANLKPGLYFSVAGIFNDNDAARRKAAEARKAVHDAYARSCEPKPGSRVQFAMDAIDESILDAPPDVATWDDTDLLSEVRAAGAVHVWIRRQYVKDLKDLRESRRTSIYLFKNDPSLAAKMTSDCAGAEIVVADRNIALTCARGPAGDDTFHQIQVLDINVGRTMRTVERCRSPKFVTAGELACQAEAVGPDGVLKLTPLRVPLKVEVRAGSRGSAQPPK